MNIVHGRNVDQGHSRNVISNDLSGTTKYSHRSSRNTQLQQGHLIKRWLSFSNRIQHKEPEMSDVTHSANEYEEPKQ